MNIIIIIIYDLARGQINFLFSKDVLRLAAVTKQPRQMLPSRQVYHPDKRTTQRINPARHSVRGRPSRQYHITINPAFSYRMRRRLKPSFINTAVYLPKNSIIRAGSNTGKHLLQKVNGFTGGKTRTQYKMIQKAKKYLGGEDRRLYSQSSKDGRLYSPSNKDGRLYSPSNKDGRLYSPSNKDRRLYSPLNKDRRLYSPSNKDRRLFSPLNKDHRLFSPPRYFVGNVLGRYSQRVYSSGGVRKPFDQRLKAEGYLGGKTRFDQRQKAKKYSVSKDHRLHSPQEYFGDNARSRFDQGQKVKGYPGSKNLGRYNRPQNANGYRGSKFSRRYSLTQKLNMYPAIQQYRRLRTVNGYSIGNGGKRFRQPRAN